VYIIQQQLQSFFIAVTKRGLALAPTRERVCPPHGVPDVSARTPNPQAIQDTRPPTLHNGRVSELHHLLLWLGENVASVVNWLPKQPARCLVA
jgi:hypothetical protein